MTGHTVMDNDTRQGWTKLEGMIRKKFKFLHCNTIYQTNTSNRSFQGPVVKKNGLERTISDKYVQIRTSSNSDHIKKDKHRDLSLVIFLNTTMILIQFENTLQGTLLTIRNLLRVITDLSDN